MNTFSDPSTASGLTWSDHLGALGIFEVRDFEEDIKTAYGMSNAVRADVHIIDGEGAPVSYEDALVFPKVLISQLRPKVGRMVLGRIGQGVAKPGQSAPWMLEAANAEDRAKAERWLAARNAVTLTEPDNPPPF